MDKPRVIFPDVQVRQEGESIIISTSVRVPMEDGSGHYFWDVSEQSYRSTTNDLQMSFSRFNQMVYMAMLFGQFNEVSCSQHGYKLQNQDDNKETEKERMKRIMLKKFST